MEKLSEKIYSLMQYCNRKGYIIELKEYTKKPLYEYVIIDRIENYYVSIDLDEFNEQPFDYTLGLIDYEMDKKYYR